ncbi:hypothetical protein MTR_5g470720 [Medicago truncatula]|uniref:Uncharacterized protein n=1 Tax=Medicago truncatula TaxID=3880 RepID=A0A072UEF9_MEDTR|nr:hypothetical protein MTR_5g470720 [Medicago truncatula]
MVNILFIVPTAFELQKLQITLIYSGAMEFHVKVKGAKVHLTIAILELNNGKNGVSGTMREGVEEGRCFCLCGAVGWDDGTLVATPALTKG